MDGWIYKLLVLFGLIKSPTFYSVFLPEEIEELHKAIERGIEEGKRWRIRI